MNAGSGAATVGTRRNALVLLAFLLVVLVPGAAIGIAAAPTDWYRALAKPLFNPPEWVFGPVWFTAYLLIALSGWLVWLRAPRSPAMAVWAVHLAINLVWPPAFFLLHLLWPSVLLLAAIVGAALAFVRLALPIDLWAGWIFTPYLAWLLFAGVLNVSVAVLN